MLRSDIQSIGERSLLSTIKPPVCFQCVHASMDFLTQSISATTAFATNIRRRRGMGHEGPRHRFLGPRNISRPENQGCKGCCRWSKRQALPRQNPAFRRVRSPNIDAVSVGSNTLHRDDAELSRLQQLGMVPGDEAKILHLREYILKLAAATQRSGYLGYLTRQQD